MAKITLFAQITQLLPKELIKSLSKKHGSDRHAKGFNSWSHLLSMIFCQFADCVSLREISNGLRSANGNLNHLGIPRAPGKSTLSYRNEHRSCEFFRDLKQNFHIKSFVGTSRNAVEIQIWTALITMPLLAFPKQKAA